MGCPGKSQWPSLSGQLVPGSGPGGWGEGWARCKGSPAPSLLSLPSASLLPSRAPPLGLYSAGRRAGTQSKSNLPTPQRPAQPGTKGGRFQSSASYFEDSLLTQPRDSAEMFESQTHGPAHPEPVGLSVVGEAGVYQVQGSSRAGP